MFAQESLDFVFLDIFKEYESCLAYFKEWIPKVRPGGLVMGHDYALKFPGIVRAVHELCPEGTLLQLGKDSTWWWIQPMNYGSAGASPSVG